MRKIMIVLICWVCTLQIYAQESHSARVPADSTEIHTVFHKGMGICKIPLGYFIEMNGGYSHFGHQSVFLPGISAGIILNHHWTVGITGSFVGSPPVSNHRRSDNDTTSNSKHTSPSRGGYGGLLLEYTLFPQSKVHVSFPVMIGGGYIYHTHQVLPGDSLSTQPDGYHHFTHGEHFFVIEPGVKLEVNLIKHMRLGLGISYRYSPEMDHRVTSPDLLNQLTAKLSLRFGKF